MHTGWARFEINGTSSDRITALAALACRTARSSALARARTCYGISDGIPASSQLGYIPLSW
jgi:hypothetical protein